MEKLRLKWHKSPRKRNGDAEEIELRETSKRSASDETEHPQESTFTESCKGPKTATLEDRLLESWEVVEAPEPEKLQGSSPENVVKHSTSAREEKLEDPVVSINKSLIKQTVTSSRFYSSEGYNGYMMKLQFSCKSTKSHRNKVNIYTFICIQPGKK